MTNLRIRLAKLSDADRLRHWDSLGHVADAAGDPIFNRFDWNVELTRGLTWRTWLLRKRRTNADRFRSDDRLPGGKDTLLRRWPGQCLGNRSLDRRRRGYQQGLWSSDDDSGARPLLSHMRSCGCLGRPSLKQHRRPSLL